MQQKFNAILVDDEDSARDVLENLLENYCPHLNIVAKCEDLEQAVNSIKVHKPDLVFMDIEMPNYAGYEITRFFDKIDFEIIFITAYDHYAIKAFEISAIDYLLKPIDIDKLIVAVNKFEQKNKTSQAYLNYMVLKESLNTDIIIKIVVPYQGYQKVLMVDDIIAIEANKSYCYIHSTENKYLMSKNLKQFEKLFDKNNEFIRTHKSWIVNTKNMLNYSKKELRITLKNNIVAKLSRVKKTQFEAQLSK